MTGSKPLEAGANEAIDDRARQLWVAAGSPARGPAAFRQRAAKELHLKEADYDKALADSFPASDPPANTPVCGTRRAERLGKPTPEEPRR